MTTRLAFLSNAGFCSSWNFSSGTGLLIKTILFVLFCLINMPGILALGTVQLACRSEVNSANASEVDFQVDFHVGTARSSNARKGRGVTLFCLSLCPGDHSPMGVEKGAPRAVMLLCSASRGSKNLTNCTVHLSCSSLLSPEKPVRYDPAWPNGSFFMSHYWVEPSGLGEDHASERSL